MAKKLSRYEILEEIGRGGVGIVYKARDTRLNRLVALKILNIKEGGKSEDIERFTREARVIAGFNHPNIVTIHDIDEEEGKIFFSMDLVEGDTLEHLVKVNGKFSEKKALSIITRVAKVLQAVHAQGVVHRDIKPSNIMITPEGEIKVLDFGTAKLEGETTLTQTGTFVGTIPFAAPEQLNHAKDVDIRSDIYSLGATLYYLLTEEPPYKGTNMEIMFQHCFVEAPSLEGLVSSETNRILRKMMAKNPEDRYQNPSELLQDLLVCHTTEADLPMWAYYMLNAKAIKAQTVRRLIYIHPETREAILNMASPSWQQLDYRLQIRYARAYQKSYAKAQGVEIEKTFYAGGTSFVMRFIPPGRFLRGAHISKAEGPQHTVVISHSFWIGKYPVTQRQWKAVTGQTPWRNQEEAISGGDCPAIFVSWNDIYNLFLPKLGLDYSLPSEAQWEYACRAGTTTSYFWGDDASKIGRYAWYSENALQRHACYAHPVGQKKPNPWGLYDIVGNVWEKCSDFYGEYPSKEVFDPSGPEIGKQCVERGGAWDTFASNCRSAKRSFSKHGQKDGVSGFRLVKIDTL